MATLVLTAELEPAPDGRIQARLLELPGVITFGATREHALEQLVDALQEYLLADSPGPTARGEAVPLRLTLIT